MSKPRTLVARSLRRTASSCLDPNYHGSNPFFKNEYKPKTGNHLKLTENHRLDGCCCPCNPSHRRQLSRTSSVERCDESIQSDFMEDYRIEMMKRHSKYKILLSGATYHRKSCAYCVDRQKLTAFRTLSATPRNGDPPYSPRSFKAPHPGLICWIENHEKIDANGPCTIAENRNISQDFPCECKRNPSPDGNRNIYVAGDKQYGHPGMHEYPSIKFHYQNRIEACDPAPNSSSPHDLARPDSEPSIMIMCAGRMPRMRSHSLPMMRINQSTHSKTECPYAVTYIYQPKPYEGLDPIHSPETNGTYEVFYPFASKVSKNDQCDREICSLNRRKCMTAKLSTQCLDYRVIADVMRSRYTPISAAKKLRTNIPEFLGQKSTPKQTPKRPLAHMHSKTSKRLGTPKRSLSSQPSLSHQFPSTQVSCEHSPSQRSSKPEEREEDVSAPMSPTSSVMRSDSHRSSSLRRELDSLSYLRQESTPSMEVSESRNSPTMFHHEIAAVLTATPLYHWGSLTIPGADDIPKVRQPPVKLEPELISVQPEIQQLPEIGPFESEGRSNQLESIQEALSDHLISLSEELIDGSPTSYVESEGSGQPIDHDPSSFAESPKDIESEGLVQPVEHLTPEFAAESISSPENQPGSDDLPFSTEPELIQPELRELNAVHSSSSETASEYPGIPGADAGRTYGSSTPKIERPASPSSHKLSPKSNFSPKQSISSVARSEPVGANTDPIFKNKLKPRTPISGYIEDEEYLSSPYPGVPSVDANRTHGASSPRIPVERSKYLGKALPADDSETHINLLQHSAFLPNQNAQAPNSLDPIIDSKDSVLRKRLSSSPAYSPSLMDKSRTTPELRPFVGSITPSRNPGTLAEIESNMTVQTSPQSEVIEDYKNSIPISDSESITLSLEKADKLNKLRGSETKISPKHSIIKSCPIIACVSPSGSVMSENELNRINRNLELTISSAPNEISHANHRLTEENVLGHTMKFGEHAQHKYPDTSIAQTKNSELGTRPFKSVKYTPSIHAENSITTEQNQQPIPHAVHEKRLTTTRLSGIGSSDIVHGISHRGSSAESRLASIRTPPMDSIQSATSSQIAPQYLVLMEKLRTSGEIDQLNFPTSGVDMTRTSVHKQEEISHIPTSSHESSYQLNHKPTSGSRASMRSNRLYVTSEDQLTDLNKQSHPTRNSILSPNTMTIFSTSPINDVQNSTKIESVEKIGRRSRTSAMVSDSQLAQKKVSEPNPIINGWTKTKRYSRRHSSDSNTSHGSSIKDDHRSHSRSSFSMQSKTQEFNTSPDWRLPSDYINLELEQKSAWKVLDRTPIEDVSLVLSDLSEKKTSTESYENAQKLSNDLIVERRRSSQASKNIISSQLPGITALVPDTKEQLDVLHPSSGLEKPILDMTQSDLMSESTSSSYIRKLTQNEELNVPHFSPEEMSSINKGEVLHPFNSDLFLDSTPPDMRVYNTINESEKTNRYPSVRNYTQGTPYDTTASLKPDQFSAMHNEPNFITDTVGSSSSAVRTSMSSLHIAEGLTQATTDSQKDHSTSVIQHFIDHINHSVHPLSTLDPDKLLTIDYEHVTPPPHSEEILSTAPPMAPMQPVLYHPEEIMTHEVQAIGMDDEIIDRLSTNQSRESDYFVGRTSIPILDHPLKHKQRKSVQIISKRPPSLHPVLPPYRTTAVPDDRIMKDDVFFEKNMDSQLTNSVLVRELLSKSPETSESIPPPSNPLVVDSSRSDKHYFGDMNDLAHDTTVTLSHSDFQFNRPSSNNFQMFPFNDTNLEDDRTFCQVIQTTSTSTDIDKFGEKTSRQPNFNAILPNLVEHSHSDSAAKSRSKLNVTDLQPNFTEKGECYSVGRRSSPFDATIFNQGMTNECNCQLCCPPIQKDIYIITPGCSSPSVGLTFSGACDCNTHPVLPPWPQSYQTYSPCRAFGTCCSPEPICCPSETNIIIDACCTRQCDSKTDSFLYNHSGSNVRSSTDLDPLCDILEVDTTNCEQIGMLNCSDEENLNPEMNVVVNRVPSIELEWEFVERKYSSSDATAYISERSNSFTTNDVIDTLLLGESDGNENNSYGTLNTPFHFSALGYFTMLRSRKSSCGQPTRKISELLGVHCPDSTSKDCMLASDLLLSCIPPNASRLWNLLFPMFDSYSMFKIPTPTQSMPFVKPLCYMDDCVNVANLSIMLTCFLRFNRWMEVNGRFDSFIDPQKLEIMARCKFHNAIDCHFSHLHTNDSNDTERNNQEKSSLFFDKQALFINYEATEKQIWSSNIHQEAIPSAKIPLYRPLSETASVLDDIRLKLQLIIDDIMKLSTSSETIDLDVCQNMNTHLTQLITSMSVLVSHLQQLPDADDLWNAINQLEALVEKTVSEPSLLIFHSLELGYRLNKIAYIVSQEISVENLANAVHTIQTKLHKLKVGYIAKQYFHMPNTNDCLLTPYAKSRNLSRLEELCACQINLLHPEDPRSIYCPLDYHTIEVVYNEFGGKPRLFQNSFDKLFPSRRLTPRLVATIVHQLDGKETLMNLEEAEELINCSVRPRYADTKAIILSARRRSCGIR